MHVSLAITKLIALEDMNMEDMNMEDMNMEKMNECSQMSFLG